MTCTHEDIVSQCEPHPEPEVGQHSEYDYELLATTLVLVCHLCVD